MSRFLRFMFLIFTAICVVENLVDKTPHDTYWAVHGIFFLGIFFLLVAVYWQNEEYRDR